MSTTLILSPLQGFTDYRFRNAFNTYFGGIDSYYAPYIRLNGKPEIKPSAERDVLPKHNVGIPLVPQIMTNKADEFMYLASYLKQLGYTEVNWNLGCPYPMVAKRGLGSGLINDPNTIVEILSRAFGEVDMNISLKLRLGYENTDEIARLLPLLDRFPLTCIGIHPRLGKQLYKGSVDLDAFERCLEITKHTLCYNGDISSVESFNKLMHRFPNINHWMMGRGLIIDPFLPQMIKTNATAYPPDRIERFSKFHDTLLSAYQEALSGDGHLLIKMQQFWDYFSIAFPNAKKGCKKVKKAKHLTAYHTAVREILDSE